MGILSRFSWVRAGLFVMAESACCNDKLGHAEVERMSDCQAKPRPISEVVRDRGMDRGRMVDGSCGGRRGRDGVRDRGGKDMRTTERQFLTRADSPPIWRNAHDCAHVGCSSARQRHRTAARTKRARSSCLISVRWGPHTRVLSHASPPRTVPAGQAWLRLAPALPPERHKGQTRENRGPRPRRFPQNFNHNGFNHDGITSSRQNQCTACMHASCA